MKAISAQKRREELASLLMQDGHIDASAQAAAYLVSHETIRKDLLYLEKIGLAKKSYGGAVIASKLPERSFSEKYTENPAEKQRIAAKALALLQPGDSIFLDSGSSVYALAVLLAAHPMEITIFTNSLKSAYVLEGTGMPLHILGGEIRSSSAAVTGMWAVQQLSSLHIQKAFLGSSGWAESSGPCIESFEEAQIKQAMLAAAGQKILLCDSTKAQKHALIQFADWQDIDLVITDQHLEPVQLAALSEKVQVIAV